MQKFEFNCYNFNKIDVSLLRSNRRNLASDNKKAVAKQRDLLITKNIKLNDNLKVHTIQGVINYSMDLDKEKYFFPPLIYESIEKNESLFPKISSNKPGYKMAKFEKGYLISPICME